LMRLPERMRRIANRIVVPDTDYNFKWMQPLVVK
jgi:acyl-[acyl-carrier-protein] desaturase